MNGYQYLVERNRMLQRLESQLRSLAHLSPDEREPRERALRAEFDVRLRELYAQVADEYPGERRKKARPLSDPS
jgi:hypothetical protein